MPGFFQRAWRRLIHWHTSRRAVKVLALLVPTLAFGPAMVDAQPVKPISYTLRFVDPQTHYVEVKALVPTMGQPEIEVMMAVWTPGSYLIREFARNLETLEARTTSGMPLALEKSQKNRWRVTTDGAATVAISYRVYAREMSVRTNWVESDFAFINGASTFLTLADSTKRQHTVSLELPPQWERSETALSPTSDGSPNSYWAADFDELVDSPIVAGRPSVHEFTVADTPHRLVNIGGDDLWDGARAAMDVESIVREHHRLWGFLPYDRYVFLNLITESGGGLEHKNSAVLMSSRWQMRERERYVDWLTLVSHELFHAWNVKRLRPVELGPFDYEREVHTRSLWVAEGLTVYYGALVLHRAGLTTRDEYLAELSDEIRRLQTTPGRLTQTVEDASYDAWIKFYRQNENSSNATVSYYTKGAVIGLLADAKIRRLTGGTKSLDDVMRLAYERFSGARGFTAAEFRETVVDIVERDSDLHEWFTQVLETAEELDYTEALDWFGLRFSEPEAPDATDRDATVPAWLGLGIRTDADRLVVSEVRRGTPGYDAGFNVGDEIVGIDRYRVEATEWARRLRSYRTGEHASVLVARRQRLVELNVTFGTEPQDSWEIAPRSVQTAAQQYRLDAWLGVVPTRSADELR